MVMLVMKSKEETTLWVMDILDNILKKEWQTWMATVAHLTKRTDKIIITMMLKTILKKLGLETVGILLLEMQELMGKTIVGMLCQSEWRDLHCKVSGLIGVDGRHLGLQYWNRNYTFNMSLNH